MPFQVRADTLRTEVKQVLSLLQECSARLEEGIPGDDIPANDLNQEIFQVQLRGELLLCSERLQAIVEVLNS